MSGEPASEPAPRSPHPSLAAAGILAIYVAAVGLAPHVWITSRVGELTYFKSAYDEDTYARLTLDGQTRSDRALAGWVFTRLYRLFDGNLTATLISADAVFPALATLSAFVLASVVVHRVSARLLLTLLLLFGQEFFSFGSGAVTWLLPDSLSLDRMRITAAHAAWLPDYSTSYFSLFRTPEPQVSLSLIFLHYAALLILVSGRAGRYRSWLLAALTISHALIASAYAFLLAPLLVVEALVVILLVVSGRYRDTVWLPATMLPLPLLWVLHRPLSGSDRYVFRSFESVFSPAVIYALALLLALLFVYRTAFRRIALTPAAIAFALAPPLLMDQQIVSGVMISTRDFERYSNYPLLALAAVILTISVGQPRWLAARGTYLLAGIVGALLIVIGMGESHTIRAFEQPNEASIAIAAAIESGLESPDAAPRVLVEDATLVPLVAIRLHSPTRVEFVLDYTEISRRALPRFGAPPGPEHDAADFHRARLFEYFARRGLSPDDVNVFLTRESSSIGTGSAFFLHFLFHLSDVWYPYSDGRLVRRMFVRSAIPQIVEEYRRFLAESPEILTRPVLYIAAATQPPPVSLLWEYRQVGQAHCPGAVAIRYVAYVQSPRRIDFS